MPDTSEKDITEKPESDQRESESFLSRASKKLLESALGLPPELTDKREDGKSNFTNDLDKVLSVYGLLPDKLDVDPQTFMPMVEWLSGKKLGDQAQTLLSGVTRIAKNGDHLDIERDGDSKIELNEKILGGAVTIKSLNMGSMSFDVSASKDNPQLHNIKGMSIKLNMAGIDRSVDIEDVEISKDKDGNAVLRATIENPFPAAARFLLGLSSEIPITLRLGPDGKPLPMSTTEALLTAAGATDYSLPGLILGTGLETAAAAAHFSEEHPTATRVAKVAVLGPAGSWALDTAIEHKDIVKEAAKATIKYSPAGLAYDLLFGD